MRCDKYTGENVIKLRTAPRPMGIVAVSNSTLGCFSNKCRKFNGGCEDICQLDVTGSVVCSCKSGRRLLNDGYRCVVDSTIFNCTSAQFQCSERECIPYDWTCDGIPQCGDKSDEDPKYCGIIFNMGIIYNILIF